MTTSDSLKDWSMPCMVCKIGTISCTSAFTGYTNYRIVDPKTKDTVKETNMTVTFHCENCDADMELKFIKERLQ